jgi:hypothetical protein
MKGKGNWGYLGLDTRITFKYMFKKVGYGSVDSVELAQDRIQCWDHVNMVMNLRIPYKAEKFFTT